MSFQIQSFIGCRTSQRNEGLLHKGKWLGQLDKPCKFPFVVKGKTYHTCTYDFSHITGYNAWCSTNTDEKNNHIKGRDSNGKKYWGVCDDTVKCNIPPRCKFLLHFLVIND